MSKLWGSPPVARTSVMSVRAAAASSRPRPVPAPASVGGILPDTEVTGYHRTTLTYSEVTVIIRRF